MWVRTPIGYANSSYMRSRMVEKNAEAWGSQLRLVFAERPREFVGEIQHVDSKRVPTNYHKHTALLIMATQCEKGWLYGLLVQWLE